MAEKSKMDAALDELLTGKSPEEIVGPGGVLKELTKALLERAMGAELSNHLGYEKHDHAGRRELRFGKVESPSSYDRICSHRQTCNPQDLKTRVIVVKGRTCNHLASGRGVNFAKARSAANPFSCQPAFRLALWSPPSGPLV